MRTKDCEVQFNLARFEQQKKDAEKQSANSRALNEQVSTFSQTELELRSQLNIYVEKFKQVCPRKAFAAAVGRASFLDWESLTVPLFKGGRYSQ